MAVDDQLTVTYDALPAVDLVAQLLANDISVAGSLRVTGELAGARLGVPAASDANHSTSAITGVESWGEACAL